MVTQFNKTILDNGIRVISERIPSVRSISIGVWVDVGSRDESKEINGISHFIEHMVFKGTPKRSAQQIAASLESLGGSLNAFTSREQTCYFAKILDEHLLNAVEVISDILLNSLFEEKEIAKEKKVVIEEINDVEDTPSDLIHDIFASTIWENNSMGYPILGTVDTVNSFTRDTITSYLEKNYSPNRIIVAASGHLDHSDLLAMVNSHFLLDPPASENGSNRLYPETVGTRRCQQKDIAQVHVTLGFPTIEFSDPRRSALLILNNILGGGMSSRLFQAVREEAGLVYSIYSFMDFFLGQGLMGTYFATTRGQVDQALELIYSVFKGIKNNSLTEEELYYAKSQLKGNLVLGLENTSNRMNRIARHEILYGDFLSIDDTIASIDAVSVDDVVSIANDILVNDKLTIAALGSVDEKELISLE
ncbi:MAG: insulinase family protein [candidate division Zixibacteria bacterium]|nr:insulinase family protein [candidate division Zixibacteria bacterium]